MSTTVEHAYCWSNSIFVDGEFVEAADAATAEVVEKATGNVLAIVGDGATSDVDRAVASAARAQVEWAAMPPPERAAVLRTAAAVLESRTEEIVDWIARETGSNRGKGYFEVGDSVRDLQEASGLATRPLGELLSSAVRGRQNLGLRVPVGVVAIVTPWNLPLLLGVSTLAPAIALGNAVVLKPAHQTPVTGGLLIAEILQEAGLPRGVLNVVPGRGGVVGKRLIEHERVDMIQFTGSTEVGREIAAIAGHALKRVSLEARRQRRIRRARRRRRRRGEHGRRVVVVPLPGSDMHQRRSAHRHDEGA